MIRRRFATFLFLSSAGLASISACEPSDRTADSTDAAESGGSAGSGSAPRSCDSIDAGVGSIQDAGDCAAGSFCELLSAAQFAQLFPSATAPYSYAGLVAAADGYYPTFARVGDLNARKREAAAFLANVAHESGGFRYAEELICANGAWMTNPDCQRYIKDGISYHGRGAIQLSFYNNYSAASKALCVDLVANPDQVATDPELAIGTAVWFWMERGGCHEAITTGQGFGATVKLVNGIECSSTDPVRISEWQDRLYIFTTIVGVIGIDPGDTNGCR